MPRGPPQNTAGCTGLEHARGRLRVRTPGANALLDSGRVAREGDAYDLAAKFGDDFSKLLVTGKTPFGKLPSLPTRTELRAMFGGGPKYPACKAFGKSPGLVGFLGERMGLPPAWTDKGAVVRND